MNRLTIKNISLAAFGSTLLFIAAIASITASLNLKENTQFKAYVQSIKNVKQRLIYLSLLTESEIDTNEKYGKDFVLDNTKLNFQDMIISSSELDMELDLIEATARQVLHGTENYLYHAFENRDYFLYFRSYTKNKFILEGYVDGLDGENIGFDLDTCEKYHYCIKSAWDVELNDRLYLSKIFNSVITGPKTISIMVPVYYNNELVGEFGALMNSSILYEKGKAIKATLSDGNRNLKIYYPNYPFRSYSFDRSYVIDNTNVLVYEFPMTKILIDYSWTWFLLFTLLLTYYIKTDEVKSKSIQLSEALLDANQDELTGLYNRKLFKDDKFNTNINSACYSLIAIDGDRVKRVNDKYGHHVGDQVICTIAKSMQKVFRTSDYLVRTGGDEFIAILPNCGLEAASVVAEKLQKDVKQSRLGQFDIQMSVSVGVVEKLGSESLEEMIIKADDELYKNKQKRN